MLGLYPNLNMAERQDAIGVLGTRRKFAEALLAAIEKDAVNRRDVSAFALQQLRSFSDAGLKKRIAALWADDSKQLQKSDEIARYKQLLTTDYLKTGSASAGRLVFEKTCAKCHVLFGDGAGAVIIGPEERSGYGIIDSVMGADGSFADLLQLPAGGSRRPAAHETVANRLHYMKIQGRAVYKLAVTHIVEVVKDLLERNSLDPKAVGLYIPHQMNTRIMEASAGRLGISMEQIFLNIEKYGNTSAASIPIALDEAVRQGRIKPTPFTYGSVKTEDGKVCMYLDEGRYTGEPIADEFVGCAGVAEIPGQQEKLQAIGYLGYRHHTSVTPGHVAEPMYEALEKYLGYEVTLL